MTTTHAPMSDSRIPTDTVTCSIRTLTPVVDCPSCAWRDFGVTGLFAFYDLYPDRLNDAGRELIRQPLREAWGERGYIAVLVCHHDHDVDASGEGEPSDDVYIEMRQAAMDRMPWGADFAAAAGLEAEYDEYRRGEQ